MSSSSPDSLFTFGPAQWRAEPLNAFDAFLSGYRFGTRRLRPSSFVIYRGMFSRLLDWLQRQGLDIFALDATRLEEFLAWKALAAETRHRYLLLFTALYEHLSLLHQEDELGDNPARELLLEQHAPEREPPEWLELPELSAFTKALPAADGWKAVRTRAWVYTVLGTGLRAGELLALKTSDILRDHDVPRHVWVQEHKPHPERKVPVAPLAQEPLQQWLKLRQELGVAGSVVFVSNLAGASLSAATLFRQVKAALQKSGVKKRYEGPTLLRNTCARLWLHHHEPTKVMGWLGHATLRTTEQFAPASDARIADLAAGGLGP